MSVFHQVFCARCKHAILEPERRKYCSDACADSAARDRKKVKVARIVGVAKYRRYPKEKP